MKLWLLKQTAHLGYDTFDSVVVAADTEEKAKQIHPSEYVTGKWWKNSETRYDSWAPLEEVTATLLGNE